MAVGLLAQATSPENDFEVRDAVGENMRRCAPLPMLTRSAVTGGWAILTVDISCICLPFFDVTAATIG